MDAVGIKEKYKETEESQLDANQKSQKAALIKNISTQLNKRLAGCCYSSQLALHTDVPQGFGFLLAKPDTVTHSWVVMVANKSD